MEGVGEGEFVAGVVVVAVVECLAPDGECGERFGTTPGRWPIHASIRSMVVAGDPIEDSVEETAFVMLELAAENPDDAERLAQDIVAAVMSQAGIEKRLFPVLWVTPVERSDVGGHRFLEQAKDLYESENYELAVVAAHIHFEVQLRLLLDRAALRTDRRWAQRLLRNQRIASLTTDVSVGTVELLLETDVRQTAHWPEFSAHIKRRNAVIHEGVSVGRREATASIKAVEGLWATLAEAERSLTLF